MALRSRTITATTTATPLVNNDDRDNNPGYRDIAVANTSAVTVYLGGPDVTTANGFPIAAGTSLALDQAAADSIPYAIVATGTATLSVLELGV